VPQSFAFDDVNHYVYVLQVEGTNSAGTHEEHGARGDLTLTQLSSDGNTIAGYMVLRGFGHGVAMGVEPQGSSAYIWTEVDSKVTDEGSARGTKLGRFLFSSGVTLDTSSPTITKFTLGTHVRFCTPSIDMGHDRLAIRYVTNEGDWRVALYGLTEVKAGGTTLLCEQSLPFHFGVVQGWCTYGSYLYVYAGEAYSAANRPPGDATIWCIDWNTGLVVETYRSDVLSDLIYREPEGLAVQVFKGSARLAFGFGGSVSKSDPRRQLSIVYKSALQGGSEVMPERSAPKP
jgi:hypothetical protein